MNKKNIVMIKTNLPDIDPRLSKEIKTLNREGYDISLLCWDRQGRLSKKFQNKKEEDYKEIPLHIHAPYGPKVLLFLPIWWCFVFWKLMTTRWEIVHSINLDTILPSLIAARLKKKPMIYEIFDVYADMKILPKLVRRIGVNVEKLLVRPVNGIILANEGQPAELNGIPHNNIVEIYNSPSDIFNNSNHHENHIFIIFFAGVIFGARRANIENVYQAILEIDQTKIIIAGYGDMAKEIQQWSLINPHKIEFLGIIDYPEVLKRTMESNLTFALYDPIVPTTRYAGCHKLFEAMMAGKPILVPRGTMMEEIVTREAVA